MLTLYLVVLSGNLNDILPLPFFNIVFSEKNAVFLKSVLISGADTMPSLIPIEASVSHSSHAAVASFMVFSDTIGDMDFFIIPSNDSS